LADAAIKADKLDEAIDHYARAGRIKETAKFDDKIQQIRATLYMKKAKQAEADGRFAEAAQAAKQALKIIPDLPDAIALLDRQQFKDDLAGLLAQGEAAFLVGAFEEAIKYWTNAQKLKLNPAIATKILASQIQIQVQKGQALYAKGDRDGAMKILEVPNVASDPVAAKVIKRIINENLYDRLMKEAQDMFDKGDYVGARRIYRGIGKKVDNGIIGEAKLKEAGRMRDVCDYEHSMSLTRQALKLDTLSSMSNALGHVGGAYSAARLLRRPRGDAIKLLEKVRDKILTMDPETNEQAKDLLDRVNQTLKGYKSTIGS